MKKKSITGKMIGWTKFQKKIAADQRGFFQERVQWLENRGTSEDKLQTLRELFPTFEDDESFQAEIAKIDAKIAEREAMNFEDLVKDMYPDIKELSEHNDHQSIEAQQAYVDQEAIDELRDKIQNL